MKLTITTDAEVAKKNENGIIKIGIDLNLEELTLIKMAVEKYKRHPTVDDERYERIEQALRDLNSPEIEVINLD